MSFRFSPLAAALALGAAAPAAAQSALADAPALGLTAASVPAPAPPALKAAYRLHLTSTWPQYIASQGCRNGGEETLDGVLTRNADGTYSGRFARHTELLFCGAHGPAAAGCSLVLVGNGAVAMTGVVLSDEASPSGRSVRVTWTPAPEHEAEVTGQCTEGFKRAVRQMYLTTPHAAEFPLTTVGSAPRTERLDSYAWEVELE
jgi:hypothetical protein